VAEIGISLSEVMTYIPAVRKPADELLARVRPDGRVAGRFDGRWEAAANCSCLTGNAQKGIVWGRIYQVTGDERYLTGMLRANEFLRKVQ